MSRLSRYSFRDRRGRDVVVGWDHVGTYFLHAQFDESDEPQVTIGAFPGQIANVKELQDVVRRVAECDVPSTIIERLVEDQSKAKGAPTPLWPKQAERLVRGPER